MLMSMLSRINGHAITVLILSHSISITDLPRKQTCREKNELLVDEAFVRDGFHVVVGMGASLEAP